jgi:hypothetical protein
VNAAAPAQGISEAKGDLAALIDGPLPAREQAKVAALLADPAITDEVLGYHDAAYQEGMTAILEDKLRHLLLTDGSGAVVGYLPFREKTGTAGAIVNALPFFGPNGLAAARTNEDLLRLLQAFRRAVSRPDVLSAVIYTPFRLGSDRIAAGFDPDFRLPRLTQYVDLTRDEPWPQVRRWDIAKARKAGFSVRPGALRDVEPLYEIYRNGCLAVGIQVKPRAYFDLTMHLAETGMQAGRRDAPLWLAAELESEVVAGLLVMRGPRTASYTIPIAAAAVRSKQPIALLIDVAATVCRRDGQKAFNFEASPEIEGPVFQFKARWGAETSSYEVQGIYPNGAERVRTLDRDTLGRDYRYFFAYPFTAA